MHTKKTNRDLFAIAAVALAGTGPVLGLLSGLNSIRRAIPGQIEIVVLLISLILIYRYGLIGAYLEQLPVPLRRLLIGFVSVMLLAQGISSYRATFPILPWTMYEGGEEPPDYVTIYECVGVGREGETDINPSHLFVSNGMGTRRMSNKLIQVLDAAFGENRALSNTQEKVTIAEDLIRAIGVEYNRTTNQQKIDEIRVIRSQVDWRANDAPTKKDDLVVLTVKIRQY